MEKFSAKEWSEKPQMKLPDGFEWALIDPTNDAHFVELADFLNEHYSEPDNSDFRLKQYPDLLKWVYTCPPMQPDYLMCVRATGSKKLMSSYMFTPMQMSIYGKEQTVCCVNFHCIHNKLKGKRLAPINIQESLRRSRAAGQPIGFYHSTTVMPTPFCTTRSTVRMLNVNKLLDIKYDNLPLTVSRTEYTKMYELPSKDRFKVDGNIRPMVQKDVKEVLRLYKLQM